ncbi:hypothetical protein HMPREF0891_0619 [Lactobacillus crispatus 214-1]|nr:hypothetical protein HMPREF0891_0619 [Lactobacillus crispatus 214-1]
MNNSAPLACIQNSIKSFGTDMPDNLFILFSATGGFNLNLQ